MENDGIQAMYRELTDALDVMDHGFLLLDENLTVRQYNRAYRQLLEIEDGDRFVDHPYSELLEFLLERGEFIEGGEHESFLTNRLRAMKNGSCIA